MTSLLVTLVALLIVECIGHLLWTNFGTSIIFAGASHVVTFISTIISLKDGSAPSISNNPYQRIRCGLKILDHVFAYHHSHGLPTSMLQPLSSVALILLSETPGGIETEFRLGSLCPASACNPRPIASTPFMKAWLFFICLCHLSLRPSSWTILLRASLMPYIMVIGAV